MIDNVEKVLVVESEWVHSLHEKRGFLKEIHPGFLRELPKRAFFIDRPKAEDDPGFRQVIPYVLVRHDGKILTVTRHKTQGEPRLHDKMSFGIGGHINPIDGDPRDVLDSGMKRELSEELRTDDPPGFGSIPILGLILSDNNDVSRVHMGIVMAWDVKTPIDVRETDKMHGDYLSPDEIGAVRNRLENWSALVYDGLFDEADARSSSIRIAN